MLIQPKYDQSKLDLYNIIQANGDMKPTIYNK